LADLITAGKLCKEEREKRGLSREELHRITKIPVDIIRRLEEDENYLRKDPYAYFLMKVLVSYYNLDIQLTRDFDTQEQTEKPVEHREEEKEERQGFFFRFFKAVFTFVVIFTAGFLGLSSKDKNDDDFLEFLHAFTYPHPEPASHTAIIDATSKSGTKKISLKANDYVWLTAYIDGREKVIKLRKGQRMRLSFKNKIRFETIGNADNLVIIYEDKKVDFEKKVVHNLFVDGEGVFFNGYNLVKGES